MKIAACVLAATVYGKGISFALNFSYSAHAQYSPPDATSGLKHVYQSKVRGPLHGDTVLKVILVTA